MNIGSTPVMGISNNLVDKLHYSAVLLTQGGFGLFYFVLLILEL
jgi:hypothetical protein